MWLKNTPKLDDFSNSHSINFLILNNGWRSASNKTIKQTNSKNAKDFFKVKKRDSYRLSSKITQNISISTTSISGNFQILNTKVCIDEEIFKNYKCTKMNAKGVITQSTNKWKTRSQNKWLQKTKKLFQTQMQLNKKNELFLSVSQMN